MSARPKRSEPSGIRCPRCGGRKSLVINTRSGDGYVRRRHACQNDACLLVEFKNERGRHLYFGVRWNTYEYFSPSRHVVIVPPDTRVEDLELPGVPHGTYNR